MQKPVVIVGIIGLALLSGVAVAAQPRPVPPPVKKLNIVAGVNLDAVDWEEVCANVKPVTVTRGGVTCTNVYPTSVAVRAYQDFSGVRPNAPPLNCEWLGQEFVNNSRRYTDSKPWGLCKVSFTEELKSRAGFGSVKYNDMTFEDWRKKYFGKWLAPEGAK